MKLAIAKNTFNIVMTLLFDMIIVSGLWRFWIGRLVNTCLHV